MEKLSAKAMKDTLWETLQSVKNKEITPRKNNEYWEAMKLARDITDFFRQEVPDRYERLKLKGKYLKYNEKKKLKRLLSA